MKHLAKILALLTAAGTLLAFTVLLCRKHRKRTCYITLYHYDS